MLRHVWNDSNRSRFWRELECSGRKTGRSSTQQISDVTSESEPPLDQSAPAGSSTALLPDWVESDEGG
jgi:hypothetical protein